MNEESIRVPTSVRILRVLIAGWRVVLLAAVLSGATAGAMKRYLFRAFEAQSALTMLESPEMPAGFAQVQRALGLGVGTAGFSLDFYDQLLRSPVVLDSVLLSEREWVVGDGGYVGRLVDRLVPGEERLALRLERARKELRSRIETSLDSRAGLLGVRVRDGDPQVAANILNALIASVVAFDRDYDRKAARAELDFAERALRLASDSLERAEGALEGFLRANRTWESAPDLRFEHERLNREMELRRTLFLELATRAQDLRLRVARDVPPVAALFRAEPPQEPAGLGVASSAILGMVCGALVGAGILLGFSARSVWPNQILQWRIAMQAGKAKQFEALPTGQD